VIFLIIWQRVRWECPDDDGGLSRAVVSITKLIMDWVWELWQTVDCLRSEVQPEVTKA